MAGPILFLAAVLTLTASDPTGAPRAVMLAPIPLSEAPADALLPAPRPAEELSVEVLVQQVLARNPSLAQMAAAWEAASARYPQAISLEDPMFAGMLGPGSFGSNTVDFAYRVEIAQKFPFPGKRRLRGEKALADARAAGNEVEDMRLQLIESAKSAFYDYYLVARALEVNAESLRLLRDFRANASTRFQTGLVPQQDVLQADVEIGRQEERTRNLQRMRRVAIARINTLMHLPPDSALPPPPKEVRAAEGLPDVQVLRATALAGRPDLQALAEYIRAEQATLGLAHKEFYPDFEVAAGYDSFWAEHDLRPQVSLRLNVPLYKGRRFAAVSEGQAKIAERRTELARLTDQVNFQVQEAYEQVRESQDIVRLYKQKILRDAKLNVDAAQSAYITGKIPFLTLIEAERNLVMLRDRYFEAVADYYRRLAALERAVGGPLGAGRPEP